MKKTSASFSERFREFIADIGRSCYDMERYRTYRTGPWQDAARYFGAFLGLLAVTVLIIFAAIAAPVPGKLAGYLRGALPDGTTFAVADHKLVVTGAHGPLQVGTDGTPFVVDTSILGTKDPGKDAPKEGIVAGRDAVFLREAGETVNAQDYAAIKDGKVTKDDLLGFLGTYGLLLVATSAAAFTFFHLVFLAMNAILFVALGAWLSVAVGKVWGVSLTYQQWIAVGLHAVTLPILADHLFWALSLQVPLTFPILYFMVMIAIILDERQSPTGKAADSAK